MILFVMILLSMEIDFMVHSFSYTEFLATSLEIFYDLTNGKSEWERARKKNQRNWTLVWCVINNSKTTFYAEQAEFSPNCFLLKTIFISLAVVVIVAVATTQNEFFWHNLKFYLTRYRNSH